MGTSYDQGMNIYVVSNCWWRDGSTVVGAATERAGAEEIAGRVDDWDDPSITGWSEWRTGSAKPDGKVTAWIRDALTDEGIHVSLYQEIICVPLAGYPDFGDVVTTPPVKWSDPAHDIMGDVSALSASIEQSPTYDTTRSFMREMIEEKVRLSENAMLHGMVGPGGKIQLGNGAGREWFMRAVRTYPLVTDQKVIGSPDHLYGIPIVTDPSLAPNEIRIGKWIYLVGTPDGPVADGTLIRIDTEALRAGDVPPNWDRITNPLT